MNLLSRPPKGASLTGDTMSTKTQNPIGPKPLAADALAVTLTAEQLRGLMREAVVDVLEQEGPTLCPVLLTRQQTAQALGCSLATLQKLVADGCPFVRLGESPRFELARVLEWLRERDCQREQQCDES
jgi:excisionase family DNA binding protein